MNKKIKLTLVSLFGVLAAVVVGVGRGNVVEDGLKAQCEATNLSQQHTFSAEETIWPVGMGTKLAYAGEGEQGRSYHAYIVGAKNRTTLFSIEPEQQQVIVGNTRKSFAALQYMGQSWSKPSLAYVSWKGQPKLVLFVGGGYDATTQVNCRDTQFDHQGYQCPHYDPDLAVGAGVYMFDAHSGDLLWWASARASSPLGAVQATYHTELKYSVVSQINTIDRDADGLVDALYFGDLGGQVFRVDFDNQAQPLVRRVVRILDVHQAQGGSPRFYQMPSISLHHKSNQQALFVRVALQSSRFNFTGLDVLKVQDGLFVLNDHDISRTDLYHTDQLNTLNISLDKLVRWKSPAQNTDNQKDQDAYGWWYPYAPQTQSTQGVVGLGEILVMNGVLYAHVYQTSEQNQVGSQVSASRKGCQDRTTPAQMYLYRFCLTPQTCNYSRPSEVPSQYVLLGKGRGEKEVSVIIEQNIWADVLSNLFNIPSGFCQVTPSKNSQCLKFSLVLQRLSWSEAKLE